MDSMPGFSWKVWKAILATSSSTTALWTALWASLPQVKGAWQFTSTPGTCSGSSPRLWKVSIITLPVSSSYAPLISASVIGRVQGTLP
ncbi:hypothetical protein D3C81_1679520 [compost metagenome]